MSRAVFILVLIVVLMPTSGAGLPQSTPPKGGIIHAWVDPHYGSDSGAATNNPDGVTLHCGIVPSHPHDVSDPAQNNDPLLHASWPFKTITAAVAYVSTALPLPNSSTISGHVWEYAIIHLLPGRYSRSTTPDKNNGLSGNGETFPIVLPNRVSVQGTSALNTLIDLKEVGPAFQWGLTSANNGVDSVIDSVAIYNALRKNPDTEANHRGMGIRIGPNVASTPTITNCFIYGNEVGIALDGDPTVPIVHKPVIMNNTIAWNVFGLWSGDASVVPPATTVGISTPTIVNNIFDSSPDFTSPCPIPWTRLGASAFEGIARADMTVTNPVPVLPELGNYNAFESGRFNRGAQNIPRLPATGLRPLALTPVVQASRDISSYTGSANGQRRGVLFVRDLLCNGPGFRPGTWFDLSPHDFRLSPAVAPSSNTPVPPGNALSFGSPNPLVDNGFFYDFPPGPGKEMKMGNANTYTTPPGTLLFTIGQGNWPFDSWDFDCEGFGNPRVADHTRYPNLGKAPEGKAFIDIGADEVGDLIVAGYRFGTTMFVELLKDSPCNPVLPSKHLDNKYLWYLGPPNTYTPPQPTPSNTAKASFQWISTGGGMPAYLFRPWTDRWAFKPGGRWAPAYYLPALTDTTPHLVPDWHPWWVFLLPPSPTNPIWQPCNSSYNSLLYLLPAAGVANPPGTHSTVETGRFVWLDGSTGSTTSYKTFPGPGVGLGGPSAYNSFDAWCVANDISTPPKVMETFKPTGTTTAGPQQCFCQTSDKSLHSFTYSLEVEMMSTWAPTLPPGPLVNSNVQSFIVLVECPGQ